MHASAPQRMSRQRVIAGYGARFGPCAGWERLLREASNRLWPPRNNAAQPQLVRGFGEHGNELAHASSDARIHRIENVAALVQRIAGRSPLPRERGPVPR